MQTFFAKKEERAGSLFRPWRRSPGGGELRFHRLQTVATVLERIPSVFLKFGLSSVCPTVDIDSGY
jgi:hypothetical protein